MDYTGILSSASKLKKNSLYKVTIAEYTKEILLQLNSLIMNAHDAGLTSIDYKLLINFRQIDENVSNKEMQTCIYHKVCSELIKKEYNVKLKLCDKYTLLTVSWAVKTDTRELVEMERMLMTLTQ